MHILHLAAWVQLVPTSCRERTANRRRRRRRRRRATHIKALFQDISSIRLTNFIMKLRRLMRNS